MHQTSNCTFEIQTLRLGKVLFGLSKVHMVRLELCYLSLQSVSPGLVLTFYLSTGVSRAWMLLDIC